MSEATSEAQRIGEGPPEAHFVATVAALRRAQRQCVVATSCDELGAHLPLRQARGAGHHPTGSRHLRQHLFHRGHLLSLAAGPQRRQDRLGAVFDGLRTGAAEAGYDVLVYRVPAAGSIAVEPATLLDGRADAVVLWPSQLEAPLQQLARASQPAVAILTDGAPPGIGQVNVDNNLLARLLVEHLVALGHRRAGVVFERPTRLLHLQERLVALRAAGAERGLEVIEGEAANAEQAAGLLARWYGGGAPARVTAVLAAYDRLVPRIAAGAGQAGLRVPEDLSLAATEAIEVDGVAPPEGITAIVLPVWEVGRQAALDAAALVDGGAPQRRQLPVQLVTSRSTGRVGSGSKK